MLVFGETALIGSRRDADGLPVPLPAGDGHGAARLGQRRAGRRDRPHRRPARWRCAARWCRATPFPPGAERLGAPHLKADADGFVDTGYPCRHRPR